PGMMTPANQPATRPMTSQAIRPPGFKAAANTNVASDILPPFFVQKQPCISGPSGALQLKFLGETPDQQRFWHWRCNVCATSYTWDREKCIQVNGMRPFLSREKEEEHVSEVHAELLAQLSSGKRESQGDGPLHPGRGDLTQVGFFPR